MTLFALIMNKMADISDKYWEEQNEEIEIVWQWKKLNITNYKPSILIVSKGEGRYF